jgi:hypothetical protein
LIFQVVYQKETEDGRKLLAVAVRFLTIYFGHMKRGIEYCRKYEFPVDDVMAELYITKKFSTGWNYPENLWKIYGQNHFYRKQILKWIVVPSEDSVVASLIWKHNEWALSWEDILDYAAHNLLREGKIAVLAKGMLFSCNTTYNSSICSQ